MISIPYTKAHGARNDFLLTWEDAAPPAHLAAIAEAICDRHTGAGADGWLLVRRGPEGFTGAIRLFNPDGGEVEISGNGTRCAAAFLLAAGAEAPRVRIRTGAGPKTLELLSRDGNLFQFAMDMGEPFVAEGDLKTRLTTPSGEWDATLLDVGNPQCAVFVKDFGFNWRQVGRELERHERFPKRTNVSFIRLLDEHRIDVRFWERGAGETQSSGTGSTGAMAASVLRGLAKSPVTVETPAGPLALRWDSTIVLEGPAEIVSQGTFFWRDTIANNER
jgi:diaminopimelate epimerase